MSNLYSTSKPNLCPGNPEGHVWVLVKEWDEYFIVRDTWRTLFKKRIVSDRWSGKRKVSSSFKRWYCSACRTFETIEVKAKFQAQYYLDRGWEVDGYSPLLTTEEANELLKQKF